MKAATRLLAATLAAAFAIGLSFFVSVQVSAQQSDRVKEIGNRLMCVCGCNQVLLRCNHVGCTASTAMLKKLDQVAARNESVDLTVQDFVQEYGPVVLPEPPRKGFNRLAILIPGIAFVAGLAIVLLRSEEHTSELQSRLHLVCRLLLEKKKNNVTGTDQ